MNYSTGESVELGDTVKLVDGTEGHVVCVIHTGQFSAAYKEADWAYLEYGTLVDFADMGLIHYKSFDEDLVFVTRANT
ncbi:hypothetical protein [Pseudorhodoplanes sinuspersici]|uniref:Uncharacterized protein n=1 Tax=Pseudorhodoplanes sinuspersici TaxID=1235591 RepID=A0A1W6ZVA1_9HYPH|nr:hypothetical protein [Pseudorhodoplanes sinuspersici]ARQ00685.1 hypothetical protein CAK95_17555 [Pseudorhodoplanes sinuspersici]RKE72292.1 hypothetical protein DFP91_0154 [Pseudorhodoplanes sinuspersici]